jgi:F420H(2)-dependent quinone reductase
MLSHHDVRSARRDSHSRRALSHWYYNLKAHPECEFGGERFVATEVTGPDEYARLFALAERVFGGYGDYRAKTVLFGRQIPLFRLEPR